MQFVVQTKYPIHSEQCKEVVNILSEASLQESDPPLEMNGHYYNYYTVDKEADTNYLINALIAQPSVLAAYLKPKDHPAL